MNPRHPRPEFLLWLLCMTPAPALCRTWHVELDGSGDAMSVQDGIGLAATGDTVLVGPGTYFEDIDFTGKDIVLKSTQGLEATVLDGSGQDSSVVIFKSGETRGSILQGFTITNGSGTPLSGPQREGGGVFCPNGSPKICNNRFVDNYSYLGGAILIGVQTQDYDFPSPLVSNNEFRLNSAERGGGAVMCFRSHAIIQGNIFEGNYLIQTSDGGGIHLRLLEGSTATIEQNIFIDNVATDQGGGIYAYTDNQSGPVLILRNFIYKNSARGMSPAVMISGAGGGIATDSLIGIIAENTIVENEALPMDAHSGGGVRIRYPSTDLIIENNIIAYNANGGLVCRLDGSASLGANIFWQNGAFDVDPVECPAAWSQSILVVDPYFCSRVAGDFRVAVNSPALVGGNTMGAYSTPGCGPVSTVSATWGRIKTLYR